MSLLAPGSGGLRILSAIGVFLLTGGIALAAMKPSTRGLRTAPIRVEAQALKAFDKLDSAKTRFGKLVWRGGLVLSAQSPNFGGWSGLEMSADGRQLLAVSDAGTWLRARIAYEGGAARSLEEAEIGPIKARNGTNLAHGRDRDAEGLALLSGGVNEGEVLVSFESNHRIGRFPVSRSGLGAPTSYLDLPKDLPRGRRDGLESVAVIEGGRQKGAIVAFTENANPKTRQHAGWMWARGTARALSIKSPDDYALTDAASLADGSLLLLERRFRILDGVRMRIRRIQAASIVPGAVLDGDVLIEADLGQEIDNMEGLAVHTAENGDTVLTILSDDNFNTLLQRTLLLQFTLAGG